RWLEQSGQMSFRLRAGLYVPPVDSRAPGAAAQIPGILQRFEALRAGNKGSRLIRVDGVKLFADAVLEGNPLSEPPALPGAAVLGHFHQPMFRFDPATQTLDVRGYVDLDSEACATVRADPAAYAKPKAIERFRKTHGHLPAQCTRGSGVLEHSEEFIREFVAQATRAGFNVHIHAISDRGVRVAVDAFEAAHAEAKRRGLTQSLAHLQLVHPEEQQRIGKLGIYSAFTYAWIVPDIGYNLSVIPFIEKVSGRDGLFDPKTYYMKNVYPVRAIKAAGGVPVWGSDAPVESRDPRPFLNLEQAVTRASDGRVLTADNAIDIHAALAAFTIDGARMLGLGERTGSIEAGKLADLVVLDQNLVELAEQGQADRISETRVLTTIFDGRVVYEATPSGGP
ncbi:MAG: amidohydrolase family protein, partial [Gammaproteobacteria bacterium]